jgi:D-alanyl-D-alanine carboxypeptidase
MPRLFKIFLLLFVLTSVWATAAPPEMVAKGLRDAKVLQGSVSILVQEVGARRPSLALNADTSRNPGSVMKLFTTYAALDAVLQWIRSRGPARGGPREPSPHRP